MLSAGIPCGARAPPLPCVDGFLAMVTRGCERQGGVCFGVRLGTGADHGNRGSDVHSSTPSSLRRSDR